MKTEDEMSAQQAIAANPNSISWKWRKFEGLSNDELYEVLRIRQQIFGLEQQCLYQDIDSLDQHAWHLMATNTTTDIVAYLRVVAPGKKYEEPSIGRVLTHKSERGKGLGKQLLIEGIRHTKATYPHRNIRISAQFHLVNFYRNVGFEPVGKQYLEDDIPHIEMLLSVA